ncbi:hypothetical protein MHM88_22745, partial [Epibacterium sp. MM17-32]|uniref:hypothetical protein n=1 Tax=Epibacterium sp. MM17-32 TaxID=2917734 RepID=UPI001EF60B0B
IRHLPSFLRRLAGSASRPVSLSSASAPPVKGVLSITSDARNPFFAKLSFFHPNPTKQHVFMELQDAQSDADIEDFAHPPQT